MDDLKIEKGKIVELDQKTRKFPKKKAWSLHDATPTDAIAIPANELFLIKFLLSILNGL